MYTTQLIIDKFKKTRKESLRLMKFNFKRSKNDEELVFTSIDKKFTQANEELEDIKLTIEAVILDNDNMRKTLLDTINRLDDIKLNIFYSCCCLGDKELLDNALCKYRDFLVTYDNLMSKIDIVCCEVFNDTQDISSQIITLKKQLKVINNNNISEHSDIHKYNELFLQEIEKLIEKRSELLKKPSIKNERILP